MYIVMEKSLEFYSEVIILINNNNSFTMKSKDISNSALCMYLSSKKDVGFWLPSNEILQKIQNLYPIQRNTFISK